MNTRHAQMILTILSSGSFTAAAKALSITQPTLSQTVRQIETQLGEPIFVRGKTPCTLTPAGELYVQAARRIIRTEQQLSEAISLLHGRAEGQLRIGLMHNRSAELLPQVLSDFFRAFPHIKLEVRESSIEHLEQLLVDDELDMALFDSRAHHPKLEYRQIASEEIVLVAGKRTALAQRMPSGTTVGMHEAENERFVIPSPANPRSKYYEDLFISCGFKPNVCMVCDSIGTALRACNNANLVTVCPFITLLCDIGSMQKLSHYHLGTDAYLPPFYIAYPKDTPLTPHAETLFSLLSNRFRAMTAYRA